MLQSKLFYKTSKTKTADTVSVSHDLLTRAGFIDQTMAGVYSFLPLGFLVLKKLEKIIEEKMIAVGGQEILMPVLQPKLNWQKTGRWQDLEILFKTKGFDNKEYALGPTHEEVISPLVKKVIFSYKDLPFYLFQIQTKFRDELRAKSGILRTKEFLMKDLYSFHSSQKDLDKYYEVMKRAYVEIFEQCGIGKKTYQTMASGGSFSKYSDEFQTITAAGEDIIYICQKCKIAVNKEIKNENPKCPKCKADNFEEKKAVEVGNIFKLGTKYSKPFELKFTDRDGEDKNVLMGCYGIGLGRLMGAIVEINNDEKGIIWPTSIAPFTVHLIAIEKSDKVKRAAQKIYEDLSRLNFDSKFNTGSRRQISSASGQKQNIEVLYDDRPDKSAGEKFTEADLIGIPYRVLVSEKTLAKNSVEVKERGNNRIKLIKVSQINKYLNIK